MLEVNLIVTFVVGRTIVDNRSNTGNKVVQFLNSQKTLLM